MIINMKKRKRLKKVITSLFILVFVFIAGLATLIFFPQTLYANTLEYKNFAVFAEEPIDENIKGLLDRALLRAREAEIFDPTYQYDIFISYQSKYNKIDDWVFDPYVAARAIDNNIIIKSPIDIQKGLAYTEQSEMDLVYMIVHEMMHCLQEHKFGKLKFNPFSHPPMWKLEGYPELISRQDILADENYNLKKEIQRYLELEKTSTNNWLPVTEKHYIPKIYFKGRLMVEYLMNIKGMNYTEILEEQVKEEEVYAEMLDWVRK